MERKLENLKVWQDARVLTNSIYNMMSDCRDYGFRDQIQRASVSIMNNIAEGSESGSDSLFVRYLNIAKGSCSEVKSMLYTAEDLGYIGAEEAKIMRNRCTDISFKIESFMQKLRNYDTNMKSPT